MHEQQRITAHPCTKKIKKELTNAEANTIHLRKMSSWAVVEQFSDLERNHFFTCSEDLFFFGSTRWIIFRAELKCVAMMAKRCYGWGSAALAFATYYCIISVAGIGTLVQFLRVFHTEIATRAKPFGRRIKSFLFCKRMTFNFFIHPLLLPPFMIDSL